LQDLAFPRAVGGGRNAANCGRPKETEMEVDDEGMDGMIANAGESEAMDESQGVAEHAGASAESGEAHEDDPEADIHAAPEEEGRNPRRLPNPVRPNAAAVDAHEACHWPFRSWCRDCVEGRGQDKPHSRSKSVSLGTPFVVADYCYLSKGDRSTAEKSGQRPILVMRETQEGATACMMVPHKGPDPSWVPQRCARWIDDMGHKKVVLKADQEPAITAWGNAVRRHRQEETTTVPENSPVSESQANGAAEQAVKEVKGMIRTLKVGLDRKLGAVLPAGHPVFPFMVEYAGALITRHKVHEDGRTSFEK
jgi:hypothetical protein